MKLIVVLNMIYWYTIVVYLKLKYKLIRDLRNMNNYIYTSKYVCTHVHTHLCIQVIILKISLFLHLGSIKIVTIYADRRSEMKYLQFCLSKANNSQHKVLSFAGSCWNLAKIVCVPYGIFIEIITVGKNHPCLFKPLALQLCVQYAGC